MLVLNTSKDPEMGLLTNSLYVQFYWNLLRIQNGWIHVFEIGHNLCGKLIMPLP